MSEEKQDTEQPEDLNDTTDGVRQDSPEDEAAVSLTEEQLAEIEMMKQMGLPVSFFETNKLLDKDKKTKVGSFICKNFIFAKKVSIQHSHTMLFFMPPTLKKWGAYWFRLVRSFVRPVKTEF